MKQENQPISNIRWIEAELLKANDYNPNKVYSQEMKLLETSLLEDGWTQPIVVDEDDNIVDGFHRWTIAQTSKKLLKRDKGFVPVATIANKGAEDKIISTVRHNRARGVHYIDRMGEIVHLLDNLDDKEISSRLGMEQEEIDRLRDFGNSLKRNSQKEYTKAWIPNFAEKKIQ